VDTVSRRNALRMFGGAVGAAVVAGGATGMLAPASATTTTTSPPLHLDKAHYVHGEHMMLRVRHHAATTRGHVVISDSSGLRWTKRSDDGIRQVWTATAGHHGHAMIHCTLVGANRTAAAHVGMVGYRVSAVTVPRTTQIGMSSPATVWSQRLAQVGTGVSARRIFADLGKSPTDQMDLVEAAHHAGMVPVISYKVGGDGAGAAVGKYNALAEKAAAQLDSYGLPTRVTYWHEPSPDISPAQYVAGSKQLLSIFKRGHLTVGPFLNGWLLDNKLSTLTSYCPDELFGLWDWFGIDTYESGTMASPGSIKPADRIPKLIAYQASRGFSHPIGIGEYNGYSAQTISDAGNAILNNDQVAFGCMWNSTIGKGYTLTGARLAAFKQTLANPKVAQTR
jgi:hypothetical protein